MHMKKLMLAVMGLAAVAGGSARAAGIAVDLHSARAVGMAGAVAGFVDDASAIYFNPAGIAQGQGLEFMIGASPIIPNFKVTPQIPGGANNNQISGVTNVIPPPFIYFTYGISDEWTVGIGVYSPYGLKVEWPPAWHPIGRTIITQADFKTYDVSPTVAYKNGPLRIGVGVQIVRATVQLQKDIGPLGDPNTYAHANLGAGTWGWGGNIGIQYEVIAKTLQLAAFYRSQVKLDFNGNAAFTNVPPQYGSTLLDQKVSTTLTLPNNVGFGVAYHPMPELVLDVDIMYTSWQQFQAIAINFQTPALNTYEAKQWHHTWNYRIGAEYTLSEHVQLRGGLLFDQTPSPTYTLLPDIPDADRLNVALGATYRWGAFRIDGGFQYIFFFGQTSTDPSFPASYSAGAYVLSLSFGFKI